MRVARLAAVVWASVLLASGLACGSADRPPLLDDVVVTASPMALQQPSTIAVANSAFYATDLPSLVSASNLVVYGRTGSPTEGWVGEGGDTQFRFVPLTVRRAVPVGSATAPAEGETIYVLQGFLGPSGLGVQMQGDPWLPPSRDVVVFLNAYGAREPKPEPARTNGFDDFSKVFSMPSSGTALIEIDGALRSVVTDAVSGELCGLDVGQALDAVEAGTATAADAKCDLADPSLFPRSSHQSITLDTKDGPRTVILDLDKVGNDGVVNVGSDADPELITLNIDVLQG